MARTLDAAIAAIADRQHGNISARQLLRLGMTIKQIEYRLKVGRLHRVHKGVYSVGRPPRTPIERAAAAVLACGEGAALSHRSALALWGLAEWRRGIEVIVPRDRRHKGITTHRLKGLAPKDLRTHNDIRVTSPARTLLDSAPTLTEKSLTRAVNNARHARILGLNHLADVVERFPRHPGAQRLEQFVSTKGGPTRSEWEDAFPAFCKRQRLPEPLMSTTVAGYEVDALFPNEKVIIELDSWEFHSSKFSFESDRNRDADTLAKGFCTVRITWERTKRSPAKEAARLHEILARRRRGAA